MAATQTPVFADNFDTGGYNIDFDGVTTAASTLANQTLGHTTVGGFRVANLTPLGDFTDSLDFPWCPVVGANDAGNGYRTFYPMAGGRRAQSVWYVLLLYYDTLTHHGGGQSVVQFWLGERGLATTGTTDEKVRRLIADECAKHDAPFLVGNGPI